MPHSSYAKSARRLERAQIARQEKQLAALGKKLKSQDEESAGTPLVPVINRDKERRITRIEQKQRHKGKRRRNTNGNQS
jgi:hypothetical protein